MGGGEHLMEAGTLRETVREIERFRALLEGSTGLKP